MLRDTRRDMDYFDKLIFFRKKATQERLDSLPVLDLPGGIGSSTSTIFDYAIIICILKHGRGDEISSMQDGIDFIIQAKKLKVDKLEELPVDAKNVKEMYTKLDFYTYYDTFAWLAFLVASGANIDALKQVFNLSVNFEKETILVMIYNLLTGDTSISTSESHNKIAYPKIYSPLFTVFHTP